MIADSFKVFRNEQEMRAGRDVARIFHHVGDQLAEDRGVDVIHHLVRPPDLNGALGIIIADGINRQFQIFLHQPDQMPHAAEFERDIELVQHDAALGHVGGVITDTLEVAAHFQRGDDLAGVDAIAIVGNAGAYATLSSSVSTSNASDGLVSTTSASLGFVSQKPALTRVLQYCHVDTGAFTNTALLGTFNCSAPGIANITSTTHPTYLIVQSFLDGTTDWQSIGTSASADPVLSGYGGTFFAVQASTGSYLNDIMGVTWGTVPFIDGGDTETIWYVDMATGSGAYTATSTSMGAINCGTLAASVGYFAATRCKFGAAIINVTPLSTAVTGEAVASGTAITING